MSHANAAMTLRTIEARHLVAEKGWTYTGGVKMFMVSPRTAKNGKSVPQQWRRRYDQPQVETAPQPYQDQPATMRRIVDVRWR